MDAVHRGHRVHQDHGLPDDRVDREVGCPQLSIMYSFLPVLRIRTFIVGFETFQNVRIRLFGSVCFHEIGFDQGRIRSKNIPDPQHWFSASNA